MLRPYYRRCFAYAKEVVHDYATTYYGADFSYKSQPVSSAVLIQIEERIKEFEYILSSADTAYENGVISKERLKEILKYVENNVEEYKEVVNGTRKLEDVSEQKNKYKAVSGSKSSVVEEVQWQLQKLGYTSQYVNGRYDDITFKNVLYFQITNGLETTGWLDVETVKALNRQVDETVSEKRISGTLNAQIEYSDYDRDGNLYVHILANEITEQIVVHVTGKNFEEYVTVEDCEAWVGVKVPKTGSYNVEVIAKSQYLEDYIVSKSIDVEVMGIIEKVFTDYGEEIQIGYEIQAGILYKLAENFVLEPCVSIADSIDWAINYPNSGGITQRSQERQSYIQSIENELVKSLPYGANYFYAGQMLGEVASVELGAVIVVGGVNATITGVKNLPNGLKLVNAQVLNATTGGFETVAILVDGTAVATSIGGMSATAVGMSVISGVPKENWSNVDEADEFVHEKPNSGKLAKNMEKAGRNKPRDYNVAAHHIVAGGSRKAERAREILEKFNIGINHEANGVFLPTTRGVTNSTYHPSMHTKEYYEKVEEMLRWATSREDAIAILRRIAEALMNGTF